jgi:RNA polymerase sigma factor (sigma-70 family)
MQQPSETRTIWYTRNDEMEPSPQWGLSCLYEYDPAQEYEDKDLIQKIIAKAKLSPREQTVIQLCVCEDWTLDSVAIQFGDWVTGERIRQIKLRAIEKLTRAYVFIK